MNFRLHVKPGPGKYDPPNSLSDNEYQILLEDIDQAVDEGNRKYGYGYTVTVTVKILNLNILNLNQNQNQDLN